MRVQVKDGKKVFYDNHLFDEGDEFNIKDKVEFADEAMILLETIVIEPLKGIVGEDSKPETSSKKGKGKK